MLESRSLLILPWEVQRREILAAHDRTPLGFATRQPKQASDFLGALFGRGHPFEIHEAEDESLLATLRPLGIWKTRWNLLDADNRLVGLLQPPAPGSAAGVRVLGWSISPAGKQEAFSLAEGSVSPGMPARFASSDREDNSSSCAEDLGTLEARGNEQCLCFSERLDNQPLLKLLLLAAVLIARD
jgi:hypothetical protein